MGNPYQCVQAARHGHSLSLTCESVLAELAEKLQLKRNMERARAAEITSEIRSFSKIVSITGSLKVVIEDPDDDPIVECAVVGQAKFIVTGDRHLLDLRNYGQIQIIRAAEFLKLVPTAPAR
jgi:putative PIN family toxin of toxin-antitoxin system